MSTQYSKNYKVPMWAVIKSGTDSPYLMQWLKARGALFQPWPANSYKETVLSFRDRGWREFFAKGKSLPAQLIMMSAVEHAKKTISPTSHLIFTTPVHQIDRVVEDDKDYARIFNHALGLQSPLVIAQVFQVAERSHGEKDHSLWVTEEPCDKKILTLVSDRVITIGKGVECDIDISNATNDQQLDVILEQKFQQLVNKE